MTTASMAKERTTMANTDPAPLTAFNASPLVGTWTYRSFFNNPALDVEFNRLQFGRATLRIDPAPGATFQGLLYGAGWQLTLQGVIHAGRPVEVRFQGRGQISGAEWIYDYVGYVVPPWPQGIDQVPAIVGSVIRTISHPGGGGGTAPAGEVASWIAVQHPAAR
jgi:hypothetical protein